MTPTEIIRKMNVFPECASLEVTPFHSAEDGSAYEVWKVKAGEQIRVLKKAKESELEICSAFFRQGGLGAPRLLGSISVDGEDYFLMEYVPGEDLCQCTREKLTKALDALIAMQDRYWNDREHRDVGCTYEQSLARRKSRGEYLNDPELERAYAGFLERYAVLPRTLCHEDLLPFNVLISEEGAVIIDWECAGILPYPTSLARLIAHGTENPGDLFYMTEEDRKFAIEYYYTHLAHPKGIEYGDYRRAVDEALLFEYCEWIMLGNKYPDADMERYRLYLKKAKAHVKNMKTR